MLRRSSNGRLPYHRALLRAARKLSERFTPPLPLEAIVVFYPSKFRVRVSGNLSYLKSRGSLEEFKGLTISATKNLSALAVAFRIEDVEAHRTPADAYHVTIRTREGKRGIEPAPLYTKEESNLGREIR